MCARARVLERGAKEGERALEREREREREGKREREGLRLLVGSFVILRVTKSCTIMWQ